MLNKLIDRLRFKISVFKVKYSHMKLMKHYLKTLEFCIHHMSRIIIPKSNGDMMLMEALLSVYEETIVELNNNVDAYRKKLDRIKSDSGCEFEYAEDRSQTG